MDWGVIGHAWAVDLLQRQMAQGKMHHAYLITGPEGVGRKQLALAFAQAVLCETPPTSGAWCGECRACRQVPVRTYPDLHWLERAEGKQGLVIEQVRELQRQVSLSSMAGGARVAVLVDFDRASEGAANALLKTLEEPPRRVHLVLTASDAEDVPATIASRCEVLMLRPVPLEQIVPVLERGGARRAEAQHAAAMAAGRPELARQLIADPGLRRRWEAHAAELGEVLGLDLAGRFALADRWKEDEHLGERLAVWSGMLAEALRASPQSPTVGGEAGALPLDPAAVRRALDSTLRTSQALERSANARLALETMMLDLPGASPRTAPTVRKR
jgi:DNA polymerase-3 subunit delta'